MDLVKVNRMPKPQWVMEVKLKNGWVTTIDKLATRDVQVKNLLFYPAAPYAYTIGKGSISKNYMDTLWETLDN